MNQDAIKARPLLKRPSSDVIPDVLLGQVVRHINRDLSKISMFVRDGLDCSGDPFDVQRVRPKHCIFEFRCF